MQSDRSRSTQLASEYMARHGAPRDDVYHVAFKVAEAELDSLAQEVRGRGIEVGGPCELPDRKAILLRRRSG
ncbi:MAG: hypothetical protein C4340_04710 [Armatimonadota bacterium]